MGDVLFFASGERSHHLLQNWTHNVLFKFFCFIFNLSALQDIAFLVRYILNLVGDLDTLGHLTTYPCMSGWGKALHFSQRNTYQCVTIISIFRLQKENVT